MIALIKAASIAFCFSIKVPLPALPCIFKNGCLPFIVNGMTAHYHIRKLGFAKFLGEVLVALILSSLNFYISR
jgi:hypothetical protein